MKKSFLPRTLSEQMMHVMRQKLRLPVTVVMLLCNLAWTMQGYGESTAVATGIPATRVISLAGENAAANLRPGMMVTGSGIAPGTYVTQVISGNQLLINLPHEGLTSTVLTFSDAPETVNDTEADRTNFTKTNNTRAVIYGENKLSGNITIQGGALQLGGVVTNGRIWLNDFIDNNASVVMASDAATTLEFSRNSPNGTATYVPYTVFERIGSLATTPGSSSQAVINLSSGATGTILAVGSNNTSTTYRGSIFGGGDSGLIKEGDGTFTWINNNVNSLQGGIRVESGTLNIQGVGLSTTGKFFVSNKTGATMVLDSEVGQIISSLEGGGRGAMTNFSNGVLGALAGNYIDGTGGEIVLGVGKSLFIDNAVPNVVYQYGGSITGQAGLIKQGENVLELLGNNTYTGSTAIQAADSINANNTVSTLRLGAYGISAGLGNAGTSGHGQLPSTTTLNLAAGSIGERRDVVFDLNGATQTVAALTTSLTSGDRVVLMGSGTLNINTPSTASSGTFRGDFRGYGTLNVLSTGADGWVISDSDSGIRNSTSNTLQAGFLNVLGGKLILSSTAGSLGDRLHVTVQGDGQLVVNGSDSIGSLTGDGNVIINVDRTLGLNLGPSGGAMASPWTGQISGDGALTLNKGASLRLTTTQRHRGGTTVNSGSVLYLDYGTDINNVPGLMSDTLRLNGGTLFLSGVQGQTVQNVTLGVGATSIIRETEGGTIQFGLGDITRDIDGGSVLQVRGDAVTTGTPMLASGIMGGYMIHQGSETNVSDPNDTKPVFNWAKRDANGTISAFTDYASTYGPNLHTDVTTQNVTSVLPTTFGSLRFDQASALTMTLTQDTLIQSGGILVTPKVGQNNIIINSPNDFGLTGGAGGPDYNVINELIIHQHNPRGSLTLDLPIEDNGAFTRLTKAGQGRLILTSQNSYSGATSILAGVLELADSPSPSGGAGSLGNNDADAIQNHGYLVFNRSGIFGVDNEISGSGSVSKLNAGEVTLAGGNSYTGPTQVIQGRLVVGNNTALGSTDGLTTVSTGGILQMLGTVVPEAIVLQGGKFASIAAGAVLQGSLTVRSESTLTAPDSLDAISLTLAGQVRVMPGQILNIATEGASGVTEGEGIGGKVVLTSGFNVIQDVKLAANTTLQIGTQDSISSFGRGTITTGAGSKVIVTTNNADFVFGAKITGGANFYQVKASNMIYLTADNDYTGNTYVGGLGLEALGFQGLGGELTIGANTYTGSIGRGDLIVTAGGISTSTAYTSTVRFDVLRSNAIANNIVLNPGVSTGQNAKIVANGLGSVNLTGAITVGNVVGAIGLAQIENTAGGVMTLSGQIDNAENRPINILNGSGATLVMKNSDPSFSQVIWGETAGSGTLVYSNAGAVTLRGAANTNTATGTAATGVNYVKKGLLTLDRAPTGDSGLGAAANTSADFYVASNARLQFNYSENIGSLFIQRGGALTINEGAVLTITEATNQVSYGAITGTGALRFNPATTGWLGLFGSNELTSNFEMGNSQTSTVRINNLTNAGQVSSIGTGSVISMGVGSGDTRLEYTGLGQATDRTFDLTTGTGLVRIAGNGKSALVLNGDITSAGNRTLHLHGQTLGNTINGVIDEGTGRLSLVFSDNINTPTFTATNNDMYGYGNWILSNDGNNFSGNVTVAMGILELNGSLGDGTGTTGIFGDLTSTRSVSMGANSFDGRKFDTLTGGDNFGSQSGLFTTGTIIFNDSEAGIATFGSNITYNRPQSGSGELVNNGAKELIFAGQFTSVTSGNWVLDGTNTGLNTIKGVISGSSVNVVKEGSGRWRLEGTQASPNTYTGQTQVARGILELAGGFAASDNSILNLTNAGSDNSALGGATLRIYDAETVGVLAGVYGTTVELMPGSTLTVRSSSNTFNGVITGAGNFVRTNNDTTARDATLTNLNTYTGSTTISSTSTAVTRIVVRDLADGGKASGIGASSNAASNLIFNGGATGSSGIRWLGSVDQETDRLFTLGAGAGAGAIWADAQTLGDYTPSLKWTNPGAIAFLNPNTSQTLTLRGSGIADNTFSPQINNNGTGITSVTKLDQGMWVLTNANSYSGGTNINHGTVAITNSSALGTGPVTFTPAPITTPATTYFPAIEFRGDLNVSNNITSNSTYGMLSARSGNSTYTGTLTVLDTVDFRIGVMSADASINMTKGIVDTGASSRRLIKYGPGSLIMSGHNSQLNRIVSVSGGRLVLNYDTNNGGINDSKLANNRALELGFSGSGGGNTLSPGADPDLTYASEQVAFAGGTLVLSGGNHLEVVLGTSVNNGANRVIREGGTAVLQMGNITRSANGGTSEYGTIDFSAVGIATTNSQNFNGILATTGTNTASGAYATVGRTTWAVAGSSGSNVAITGLETYNNNTFGSALNTDILSSITAAAGTVSNTLRFNSNTGATTTLTLAGGFDLTAGGVLVTPSVTGNVIITGASGVLRRGVNTSNLDTIFHHHGSGLLILDVVLANNVNAQALTKTGTGTMVLNKANTITGRINIQQGILQVGDGTAATAGARLGGLSTGNAVSMADGATLRINVADPDAVLLLGTLTGGGLLHLAPSNDAILSMASDNGSWVGDILVEGGTMRWNTHLNSQGVVRGAATFRDGTTLDLRAGTTAVAYTKRITFEDGSKVTVTNAGTPSGVMTTLSGVLTLETDTAAGFTFDVSAGENLMVSNVVRSSGGFTKTGTGLMNLTANQFEEILAGTNVANAAPTLMGQVVVAQGELRLGYRSSPTSTTLINAGRALGGTGLGNETLVRAGATLDLHGNSLNFGDDPNPSREIVHINGAGVNGTGALRNSTGLGAVATVVFDGDATMSGGGFVNGGGLASNSGTTPFTQTNNSRLVVAGYDTNPNTSSVGTGTTLEGNYNRVEAVIDGKNANLTIVGNSTFKDSSGAGVTFRDPNFVSNLNSITVSEGTFRIDQEAGSGASFNGLTAANHITNGIKIAYGGPTLADHTNATLGLGPNVGARMNFFRNFGTNHSVDITMDGVTAKANSGANYIDMGTDGTIPNPRTYLSGRITLLGDANRNFFHVDAATLRQTVAEQGNLTGTIQTRLIINGALVGSGGFTKTGLNELRLTNNNTFTGEVNVLRFGTSSVPWQDNKVTLNGVEYQTLGDAEGWAEWGMTLTGANGTLSGTSAINLQRRGLLTLDNTNRLDQTNMVTGGNNNDRINDAASINFNHGWMKIIGGTVNNTESLATTGNARVNILSGTNTIELMPTNGANTRMVLNIGEISRSPGSILQFTNTDSTSKFGALRSIDPVTGLPVVDPGLESVQVLLQSLGTLTQVGGDGGKGVVVGLFGGIMPHEYLSDVRELAFNNGGVADYLIQGRLQQAIAASHFMTWDSQSKVLRPLDDGEYFVPTDGLIDNRSNGAAGQNVNLLEAVSILRQNTTVNSLRFGPLSDSLGNNGAAIPPVNGTTTLTSYVDAHTMQLLVDGRMTISSGMISSAYFTTGNSVAGPNNTGSYSTLIAGGTLNFGNREAIINNQNATIRTTDGTVVLGNLEIRSVISGRGGLLKTGVSPVFLDGRNTYTGVTTVSNGNLFLRHGRQALGESGEGNGVVIEGNGNLLTGGGIQVGSPTAYENILVKALQADQFVMRVDTDVTNWYSNLTIDNVDLAGQVVHTPIVRTDNGATAIFNGDIYGGNTPISQDIVATSSRLVNFQSAGNNTLIFRGQFGDKSDANGNATSIANQISTLSTIAGQRTNQNEVLRVRLQGANGETNFVMEQQYNAVGRLTMVQGNLVIDYDPNAPGRDGTGFWTDTAMSKIPGSTSSVLVDPTSYALSGGSTLQGFNMETNGNSGSIMLTKPGQSFNMATWSASGAGTRFIGGLNETGSVFYGSSTNTGSLSISGTTAVRLYAMAGGTVIFDQRMEANASDNLGIMKTGRGTVVLKNSTNANTATVPLLSNFEISGGKLVLDHDGPNTALVGTTLVYLSRVGARNAILGGGVVHALSNQGADSVTGYSSVNEAGIVLTLRAGSSTELIAEGRGGRTMTVNVGNSNANSNNANLVRGTGATLNFVEATGGVINFNFNAASSAAATNNQVIPWATFSNTPGNALDFAMSDGDAGNRVKAYNRSGAGYINNAASWTTGMNVSELSTSGFFGTISENKAINTLRYDSATDNSFNITNGQTLTLNAGGLLVSSNTGSANKTISGGTIATSSEFIIHQYGLGTLTINSTVAGNALVINGPMTTSPDQFDSSGVVRLTGNNTYTGPTYINGSVLEISNTAALGINPPAAANGHLTLNGGTLRWTGEVSTLGNRGITLNGNGGVIDVVNATGNLIVGTSLAATPTQPAVVSAGLNQGDLVKMGAGSLTLLGPNPNFTGLMDVREGSLILMHDTGNLNTTTAALLGTSRSWTDATILREGTDLQLFLGNGNNGGDWTVEEYFTFKGGNTVTYGSLLDITVDNSLSLALGDIFNLGSRRPLNLNGALDIQGATTFDVTANGTMRFNNNSGYIKGSGDVIKDGQGQLHFRSNSPDWTGNLVIMQGTVMAANQADVLGTGYTSGKTITLGSADRSGAAELLVQQVDSSINGWLFEINQDINVVYNPAQVKRLGIDATSNASEVHYNGDITLNDNLVLLIRDVSNAVGGEQAYVNFNGSFRDGAITSGNLLVQTDDTNTTPNDLTQGRNYGYAVLNGDNSGWTGDITIGKNTVYNQDTTAILRIGHSKALTGANDVRMSYNSILQTGGKSVTIGNLTTQGGDGGFFGNAGTISSTNGSSEIIENASSTASTLTISQTTPGTYEASWDAYFRDGTLNSQFFAPGANILQPSAPLNLSKSGGGWATLSVDNDYTGTTVVQQGVLQVGRNGYGDTGAVPTTANRQTLMTRVLSGATIAGTGIVQGKLTVLAGGTLKTGDSAGEQIGTLTVTGDAIFASGANALMQVRSASYNNPGVLMASDEQYKFWRNNVTTDAFATALNNLVTTSQHDQLVATGNINLAPGTKITVAADGYTPKAGDIIRLFNGTGHVGGVNVGPDLRKGGEGITSELDLILFALGGNLLWDVSLFNTHGILMVVESDVTVANIQPPVITAGPTSNRSQTEQLPPGTLVTLTAAASSTPNYPVRYQWILNGIPVAGATSATYTFEASYNTKGVYRIAATNAGGTTLSPLDTAVTVLVEDVPDITFDTTTKNVNPNSSFTFDVAVGGEEPFTYQWRKDGIAIPEATDSTFTLNDISEADQGYYSVVVTNEAGVDTSGEAFLNVRDPITSVVVTVNPTQTYLGQDIRLTAVVDGDGPFTYQWRKGSMTLLGATSQTFTIENAQLPAAGQYSVLVTSAANSLSSSAVTIVLLDPKPAIVTAPVNKTVLSGQPLEIKVGATGLPNLRYTWKQNNRTVPNAEVADISKAQAAVSDGGTYTVQVANSAGKVDNTKAPFAPAEIVVVDSRSQYLAVAPQATATLVARVGVGPKNDGVTYQWNRVFTREVIIPGDGDDDGGDDGGDGDGDDTPPPEDTVVIEEYLVPIVADDRISGVNTNTLKITQVRAGGFDDGNDEGLYRVIVTGNDGVSVTGSEFDLRVFTQAPEFAGALNFENALLGRDYNYLVPINRADRSKTPEKITATGLPPGLSIDPFSGLITGRPTATKAGGYTVKVTLANKIGKVTLTGTLIVDDLMPTLTGVWVGLVDRDPVVTDGLGGRMDLTITTKATFSGKLLLGGQTYSFKGPLNLNDANPSGSVYIKRRGKPVPPPVRLDFSVNPTTNTLATSSITDGTATVAISEGWRMITSKAEPAEAYTGYYTMAIGLPDDSPLIPDPVMQDVDGVGMRKVARDGNEDVPLGSGYATFTVAADGKLKMTGKMPDGETLTSSTFVGPEGQIAVYQAMYKRLKPIGGSLHGKVVIDDQEDIDPDNNSLAGSATWVRPASTKATERTFKDGFGVPDAPVSSPLDLIVVGGRYNPPAANTVVLGLPDPGSDSVTNARIEFFNSGDLDYFYRVDVLEANFTSQNPNADLSIFGKNSKIVVSDPQIPAVKTTVRAVAKSGLVSGTFVVTDFNPRYPLRPFYIKRSVKFQGVIIQEAVEGGDPQQIAVGYFLLPQLPDPTLVTTPKTSPIYSGRFVLEPVPVTPLP